MTRGKHGAKITEKERRLRERTIEKYLRLGFLPHGIGAYKAGRSAVARAAEELKMRPHTLSTAVSNGYVRPDWSVYKEIIEKIEPVVLPTISDKDLRKEIPTILRKTACSIDELASRLKAQPEQIQAALNDLKDHGVSLHNVGGVWYLSPPQQSHVHGPVIEIESRKDNTFCFGAVSDQHIGSKYHRNDVLCDLYDRFEKASAQCVFNAGNWIDGEASFNLHDLVVHGIDNQMRLLAKLYPKKKNIKTYAVAGDDHEGWYSGRLGIDVGRYAEVKMHESKRDDWINIGYMEAHVRLVNKNTGAAAILSIVHPGGGSAYAISYSIQKIIEVLDGGEKPAVALYGHYHKLWAGNIRNVWVAQTGCQQDQTPFMRKKKIDAHVGGLLIEMEQDPVTGAIIEFTPRIRRYFNRGYYNDRWSHSDIPNLPMRTVAP